MGIKQALFLGGAVVVLAACSDATSPGTQMQRRGTLSSAKAQADTTTTTTSSPIGDATTLLDCSEHGFVVASGRSDSTCTGGQ